MDRYTPEAAATHRETHAAYVREGGCPAVHWSKAWCNRQRHDTGAHVAANADKNRPALTWLTSESVRCPCDVSDDDA